MQSSLDVIGSAFADRQGRPRPPGYRSARPKDLDELAVQAESRDFALAWSDFPHDFYEHKDSQNFRLPPPAVLGTEYGALLAGVAEFLCERYSLPVPAWVHDPRFFLPEVWDFAESLGEVTSTFREARLERTPEALRRRNVIFEARSFLVL